MQQPLRLYRSLLRAQRQFPQDAKRAASGQDMRSLLQDRIRKAFEQSRGASGAQVGQLMQAGETELQALRTITTSHFATEYPSQLGNHGSIDHAEDGAGVNFQIFGRFWKS